MCRTSVRGRVAERGRRAWRAVRASRGDGARYDDGRPALRELDGGRRRLYPDAAGSLCAVGRFNAPQIRWCSASVWQRGR